MNGSIGITGSLSILGANITLGNVIHNSAAGAGALIKSDGGTLTLSGANTYTGATTVSAGTLALSGTGSIATSSGVALATGATFDISGHAGNTAIKSLSSTVAGQAGAVVLGSNTLTLSAAAGSFGGVVSGTGGLSIAAGTETLTGANTYTGATTVSAGILNIQNNTALGTAAGGTTVASGATLQLQGGITVGAEALSIAGTGVGGNGALQNVSGANAFGGTVTLTADARIQSDAGTLTLNGANAVTGGFNLTVGGAGNTAIAGTITTGAHTLTKDGTGTLTLSAANTFTGGTALNAGTLELVQSTSAGSGAITFAAGSQKLQIDVTGILGNTLTSLGSGDKIDFQALNFTGAQRVYDATAKTLTVTNGGLSNTIRLDAGTTLNDSQFVLSADGDGSAIVTIGGGMAPAAPTGSIALNGNRVTFDGTQNVTATKSDALIITVDPQNFAGGAEQNGNVVLSATNGTTATIQNAFLNSDGIPNTFLPQGDFLIGRAGFSITSTKQNSILLGVTGGEINNVVDPSLAAGSHFIAGGVGRVDPNDGADFITIGGKGKWSVFANAGDDQVNQDGATTSAFDSASVVNVFGQNGNDQITLANVANKASIFVGGGAGLDTIAVVNSGATTIFGGDDSTDGADRITFNGVAGAGGTAVIFGNGGNDTIAVGTSANLDSTSTATVYGGFGDDRIAAAGTKATLSIIGGEGSDTITVQNTGSTYITGGNLSGADQSLDGADSITFTGSGNALVYGNVGADTITLTLNGSSDSVTSNVSVYGGKDNDLINITASGTGKATIFVAGGENSDNITVAGNGGATTIYGGISNADSADGADTISYRGDGTANIFGNGGDDSIRIGTLGTADSTNATVTVSGGGGADSISVTAQASTSQTLNLSGNEGNDTFTIAKGTGQTITVTDFATSGDKLALTGLGGTPGNLQVTSGSFQTLQDALNAAANTANGASGASKAAAVAFAGSTYVVIDSTAGAGFQATDQAIKLTGVTDLVGLIGSTSLVA